MGLKRLWTAFYQRLIDGGSPQIPNHKKEIAVLDEMERILLEIDSTVIPVHRFRKKMLPSVRHTMQYFSELISQVPGPVDFDPGRWDDDPLLRAMFISRKELSSVLQSSKALKNFFRRTNASQAFGMLIAEQKEKNFLGTGKDGEIVRRDVPQKAVFFENFEIVVPEADLAETRLEVQHHALVGLFTQAFEKITDLQSWKQELEEQQHLLKFKVNRAKSAKLESELKSLDAPDNQVQETLQVLGDIQRKIKEIEAELDTPEHRLEHLCRILKHPEQHLKVKTVLLKLSRLGIRLDSSSTEPANEFTVAKFEMGQTQNQVVFWIRVDRTFVLSV